MTTIDPFKGADYIDPGKNAEKLSSNVDREHAQREAYEQQRYAKQQQTPQRTPHTPTGAPSHTTTGARQPTDTNQPNDTHKKKSRIPIIIIAIAVLTIIAMNLVGTIVSHGGLDSIADRLDPNTEKYEQLSEQKTINETSGNLYSYGGMALTVTIKNMEVGPTDINGQPTVKVTYGCRNLSRRAIYPNAVADSIVTQNGIELRKAVVTGYNGNLDLASKKIKSGETSEKSQLSCTFRHADSHRHAGKQFQTQESGSFRVRLRWQQRDTDQNRLFRRAGSTEGR